MEFFKWLFLIILVIMAAEVIKYYIKSKNERSDVEKELKDKLEKLDGLEQRIQTLEKLVTDPSESLKRKFDELN